MWTLFKMRTVFMYSGLKKLLAVYSSFKAVQLMYKIIITWDQKQKFQIMPSLPIHVALAFRVGILCSMTMFNCQFPTV